MIHCRRFRKRGSDGGGFEEVEEEEKEEGKA